MLNRRRKRQAAVDEPLEITHAEMNAAIDSGDATPLGPGLGWVARYGRGWWVEYEDGWLRVLDDAAERDLDAVAARLASAGAIAAVDSRDSASPSRPGDEENGDEGIR
jgi:hypothetical protein